MFMDMDNRASDILDHILANDAQIDSTNIDSLPIIGLISKTLNFDSRPYPIRYFYATYNEWGKLINLNVDAFPEMEYDLAENVISNFNSKISSSGYDGIYKYKSVVSESGTLLVYLDQSINLYSILLSLSASGLLLLVFLVFIFFVNSRNDKDLKNISNINVNRGFSNNAKICSSELNETNEVHIHTNDDIYDEISIFSENGMNKIVAELLLLSNLNVEGWLTPFEQFNFSDVILETVFSFQTIEEVRHKQIEINIHRNIIVNGNKKYLKKCIELLMDNSIKYSDDRGNIVVSLDSICGDIRFSIKNSCNLDALGNLDLLFQPFYRRSCQLSNNGCNFGMGLAVVKKIVNAHNAQIFASGEGDFIEFVILFPKMK